MAKDLNSLGTAIAFSILTSIALTSLFESISQMEDPFVGIIALDGIDVHEELQVEFRQELIDSRNHCFPGATPLVLEDVTTPILSHGGPELRILRDD
jgi:hypothetical protein